MAITIAQNLYPFNPVRNPVRFVVTANPQISAAVAGESEILFDGGDLPSAGDTMSFTWAGAATPQLVYTFRVSPNSQLLELPTFPGGDMDEWIGDIVTRLMADYYINDLMTFEAIVGGPNGFTFNARTAGADTFIRITTDGFSLDTNDVNPEPEDATFKENHHVVFELFAQNGSHGFIKVVEDTYDAGRTGTTAFQIEDVLRSRLHPTEPIPSSTIITDASPSYATFYVRAAEIFGSPSEVKPMVTSEVAYAYLAGRNEIRRITNNSWENDIHAANLADPPHIKFLSIWPNTDRLNAKRVHPAQLEYLSVVVPDVKELRILCDLYYETGDPVLHHQLFTVSEKQFKMLIIPIGPAQKALEEVDDTRRLAYYRVYVAKEYPDHTSVSEYRYFNLDRAHQEHRRELLYWTSSGGFDTCLLHGVRAPKSTVDITRSKESTLGSSNLTSVRDSAAYLNSIDTEHEVGTALVTPSELPALNELLSSEHVVELVGGKFHPVEILTKSIDLADHGQPIASRSIEYRYAVTNTAQG